jgi:methyl-accepting chemotaxis protein
VGAAARGVGSVAKRAKTPLLAGGAALAGLAGALLVRSRDSHRHGALGNLRKALPGNSRSRGLSLPKLPKRGGGVKGGVRKISQNVDQAAGRADQLSQRVSKAANAVQQVSQTADKAARKV